MQTFCVLLYNTVKAAEAHIHGQPSLFRCQQSLPHQLTQTLVCTCTTQSKQTHVHGQLSLFSNHHSLPPSTHSKKFVCACTTQSKQQRRTSMASRRSSGVNSPFVGGGHVAHSDVDGEEQGGVLAEADAVRREVSQQSLYGGRPYCTQ